MAMTRLQWEDAGGRARGGRQKLLQDLVPLVTPQCRDATDTGRLEPITTCHMVEEQRSDREATAK